MAEGLDSFLDEVFLGPDHASAIQLQVVLPDLSGPADIFETVSNIFMTGCARRSALYTAGALRDVGRRLERFGVRCKITGAPSTAPLFPLPIIRFEKLFGTSLADSTLRMERHGAGDECFTVSFELFLNTGATLIENMCANPMLHL